MNQKIDKQFIFRWGRRLLIAGIIGAGLFIGAIHLLLLSLPNYRANIELLASEILDRPVTIRNVTSGWRGLHPVITLEGIQSRQLDGQGSIHLDSLDIMLSIVPSVLAGELRPKAIFLHIRQLNLFRRANGKLSFNLGILDNVSNDDIGKEQLSWLKWIRQQPDLHVGVERLYFSDAMDKLPDVELYNAKLDFVNQEKHIAARLSTGDSQIAEKINLTVSLDTRSLKPQTYQGDLYLRLKAASLPFWQQTLADIVAMPDTGKGDVAIWIKLDAGKIEYVTGTLSLDNLSYNTPDEPAFSIDQASAKFNWQPATAGWFLQITRLQVQREDSKWPEGNLAVEYTTAPSIRLLMYADYLKIQDFLPLIHRQPITHIWNDDKLRSFSPSGEINNIKLQLAIDSQNQITDYIFRAKIKNFSTRAHGEWPGVKGIDGFVSATTQAGVLRLTTSDALWDMPTLFKNPLSINTLSGDVYWQHSNSRLIIESGQLDISNQHITTRSRLHVRLQDEDAAFVDLQTDFKDGDGAYMQTYLPISILDEETLTWLSKSIVSGDVEYGTLILRGMLDSFPFDNKDGQFEVYFKARDGILDYYEDWPIIDKIETEVAFAGRSMQINIASGKIFDADIDKVQVLIKDLDNPVLLINGKVRSSAKSLLRYLKETNLVDSSQAIFSALDVHGRNKLQLSINFPLSDGEPTIKGEIKFLNNRLQNNNFGLQIDNINGALHFTKQSFTADNITALFKRHEVGIDVDTITDSGNSQVHITAKGQVEVAQLFKPENKILSDQISGVSPFEILINIADNQPTQITLRSLLFGTQLAFPYPFNKQAEETLGLVLQAELASDASQNIKLTIDERLRAFIKADAKTNTIKSAYVTLGAADTKSAMSAAGENELIIDGQLDYLDIDAWQNLYQQIDVSGTDNTLPLSLSLDLQIDRVEYARWFTDNTQIHISEKDAIWRVDIAGEGAQGNAYYDAENSSLKLDMQHLKILKHTNEEWEKSSGTFTHLQPADLPSLDINIIKLFYDNREMGTLFVKAYPEDNQYTLETARMQTADTDARISGSWQSKAQSGANYHVSHVTVGVKSNNLGQLMKRLNYVDTIKEGKLSSHAELKMDGSPMDFDISNVSGDVSLSIRRGEVVEISQGRTGRLFGLFSFQALQRRLSLDFRDIFSKGMRFDKIKGVFTLSQGHAYTNNIAMSMPAAQVDISGRVGLKDQDYDQHIRVKPKLSATLPVAGLLAGGATVGLAAALLARIWQEPIDQLTASEYHLTGSWEAPNLSKITNKKEVQNEPQHTPADDTL